MATKSTTPKALPVEKTPLEIALNHITVWLYGAIISAGETHIAIAALQRLGAFYGQVLSRLDHTKTTQLPSNRANALVSNRGIKCVTIEAACYFIGDNTRYEVVMHEKAIPTSGHNYAGQGGTINDKSVQSSTPESLIGDYSRGLTENESFDNRETLFLVAYLFDQILSGLAWSAESCVKSSGLRLLVNSMSKLRLSMSWGGKNPCTIVYDLEDVKTRCESYKSSWLMAYSVPFAGIAVGKAATVKIDSAKKAELKSQVFADF
jgi:hypothetical protein